MIYGSAKYTLIRVLFITLLSRTFVVLLFHPFKDFPVDAAGHPVQAGWLVALMSVLSG